MRAPVLYLSAAVAGLFLVLAAPSCGPAKAACSAATCLDGCCSAEGACESSNNNTCGNLGSACVACPGGQTCQLGSCKGFTGVGGGTGGSGGGAGGGGGGGLGCAQTCAGCCTAAGSCTAGGTATECGSGGATCASCSGTQTCLSGICANPSCSGCTDGAGACQTALSDTACGHTGVTCLDCTASQATCFISTGVCTGGGAGGGGAGGGGGGVLKVGESCANPQQQSVGSGPLWTASFSGTTTAYSDDSSGTCGGSGAPDHVHSFYVPATANLQITLINENSGYQPVIYLRNASCSGSQLGCNAASSFGGSAALSFTNVPIGNYYLWVDGVSGSSGDYSVEIVSTPPGALPGDNCTSGLTLLSFSGTTATTSGTLVGFLNDTSSTDCSSGAGPDRVYGFTLAAPGNVTATVTTSFFTPVVSIRGPSSTCTAGSELSCGGPTTSSATATSNNLAPGTYWVWVDSTSAAGPFTLTVTATAVSTGGTCAAPTALTFNASGMATVTGGNGGTSAIAGTCSGAGPESVYFFSQPVTGAFSASAAGASTNRPVLYLRSACTVSTDLACTFASGLGGTASISVPSLAAGSYYLVADSYSGSSGGFTLTASQAIPAPNAGDGCSNPRIISMTGTAATASGDTSAMVNNNNPSCDSTTSTGSKDMVFQFVAPRAGTLTVTTSTPTTPTPEWDLDLSVRSGAVCATSTEVACQDPNLGAETALVSVTAGTTYWIWIGGYDQTFSGPFTVDLSLP